ncbi:MAG TPA: ankyrin repeat domain-containing protein, partial [Vicinamibacterales bacterium]|nr:ankyrin repeat domain-containing protein [Vicinamibacterales bacterium]
MPARSLPARPNPDQLKLQAKELLHAHRDGSIAAAARIAAHHPRFIGQSARAVRDAHLVLADAQLVLAREYGFESWPALRARVQMGTRIAAIAPHPRFEEALAAFDAGDAARLRELLRADPPLARARTNLDPPYGYFSGATLLHFIAGNPSRDRPLPATILELARVIVAAGADVRARTLGPNGGDTMGLLLTSKAASDAGVTAPLVDLLLASGASVDVTRDDCLDASLANHAPRAAEKLIALGANSDLLSAAALGRLDLVQGAFHEDGTLRDPPRRGGRELDPQDAIGLAALYAYVRGARDVVDFLLEKDGNWNITGVNNGTILHRAAFAGDLEMVKRLVQRGADVTDRNNPFRSTPPGWAEHNKQQAVFDWLVANTAVDLHDAVAFDLRAHVEARLREDSEAVNRKIDHWDLPQGTALHWAAALNSGPLVELLLAHGGDRDSLAGNGMTPLETAEVAGAETAAAILRERGARRAVDVPGKARIKAQPLYRVDARRNLLAVRPLLEPNDWNDVLAAMEARGITGLDAAGQMTDALLEKLGGLAHVTDLELSGSKGITDAGMRHLTNLPRLRRLDLAFTGISDGAAPAFADCHALERLWLIGTRTGDPTIRALAGKAQLRTLGAGLEVSEAGLAHLHAIPRFKAWDPDHPAEYGLMDYHAGPTYLKLEGSTPLPQNALQRLIGLDGLFALNLDHPSGRPLDLAPLAALPKLGWLGHPAHDEAMRQIGALPHLRMLMAQDTDAGDQGFTALSRSKTIEYIWGRRCYNLTGRGFTALAAMPALRGLSVSCRNVDDDALAVLPSFPALRELMPMDVTDAGFRHVGGCRELVALWCMYSRETTDAATEHIAGLQLRTYYAGATQITDHSLEILSRMPSLEKLSFWNCAKITDAGIAALAGLPRLLELTVDSCAGVTPAAGAHFPPPVRV